MVLPTPNDERLLVIVFGPGTGELILVRAPGGRWLVVDGCRRQGKRWYAERTLEEYDATPSIIVLTHAHEDHAGGVASLIERHTSGAPDAWPLLGMVEPPSLGDAPAANEHARALAEQAVAAILDRWERHPACAWTMEVGDRRTLGEATVTPISPAPDARGRARQRYVDGEALEPNAVASALLVEWRGARVILGSDLEPSKAWNDAVRALPGGAVHHGLKVAHHGSVGATHHGLLQSAPTALRVVTPFASQNLPRFEDEGGVAQLHMTNDRVHLTGLPRRYAGQGGPGGELIARAALLPHSRDVRLDPPTVGFPDCYVAMEFDEAGQVATHYGPGSVVVTK